MITIPHLEPSAQVSLKRTPSDGVPDFFLKRMMFEADKSMDIYPIVQKVKWVTLLG